MRYYCVFKSCLDFQFSLESQGSLLLFFALFNFQDAVCSAVRELFYYTTFSNFCQPLFRSFLNSFLWPVLSFKTTAYLLYHISSDLSSTFFKFFSNLFQCVRRSLSSLNIISLSKAFVKYFYLSSYFTFSVSI